jgi:hypothetical protein
MAHLIDDEAVAKMGHPVEVVRLDVGHPSRRLDFRPTPKKTKPATRRFRVMHGFGKDGL